MSAQESALPKPAGMADLSFAPATKKRRSSARHEARKVAGGANALQNLVLILAKLVLTDSRAVAEFSST
eukprot:7179657-Pyramimonas_sp.AAC.1